MAQIYKQILNLASFSLIIYQGARVTALLRLIGANNNQRTLLVLITVWHQAENIPLVQHFRAEVAFLPKAQNPFAPSLYFILQICLTMPDILLIRRAKWPQSCPCTKGRPHRLADG